MIKAPKGFHWISRVFGCSYAYLVPINVWPVNFKAATGEETWWVDKRSNYEHLR